MLEARNAGKAIADARGEMGMVVDTFRYYAGAPERLLGDTIPVAGGQAFTVREPVGVVGLITPWNFPLTIASWKLAPALAAGNTVVLKPAELTPLTALRFAELALRGGHPRRRRQRRRRSRAHVRAAPRRAPRRRQDRVHRLDRGRTLDRRRRRADDQARDARARRQVGQHRLRRRRPRGRRRGGADGGVRQRRPGLLRALAHPRAGGRRRSLPRAAGDARQGAARRRPAGRGHADGPADLRRPARDRLLVPGGRRAGGLPRQRARGPGLLVRSDGARPGQAGRPRRPGGGVRADRRGDRVHRRGRGDPARQRHDLWPVGVDLDARRRPRAARRARRRDRRAVDQLEQLGAGEHAVRRLQAVRLRARARPACARGVHRGQDDLLCDGGHDGGNGRQARRGGCAW